MERAASETLPPGGGRGCDSAEKGDAQRAADLLRGIHQGSGDARVVLGHTEPCEVLHGNEDHAEADAHQDQCVAAGIQRRIPFRLQHARAENEDVRG